MGCVPTSVAERKRVSTSLQGCPDHISRVNEKGVGLPLVFYCRDEGMQFKSNTPLDHTATLNNTSYFIFMAIHAFQGCLGTLKVPSMSALLGIVQPLVVVSVQKKKKEEEKSSQRVVPWAVCNVAALLSFNHFFFIVLMIKLGLAADADRHTYCTH